MLYNRDSLLSWFGELVGLHYVYERRIKPTSDPDLPVVLVTGVNGSGRTSVLTALTTRYQNRTPLCYVDLAEPRLSGPFADTSMSTLVPLLDHIVSRLSRGAADTGRFRLPRLMLALLTLSLWPSGEQLTDTQAAALVRRAGEQLKGWIGGDEGTRFADRLGDLLSQLIPTLGLPIPAPVGVLAVRGIQFLVNTVLSRGQGRAALAWWQRHHPDQPGTGEEKVQDAAGGFHAGDPFRADAELDLVAALLADLAAEFGQQHRLRTRRPLLLIDNLDRNPVGPRLIDLVLKNRQGISDPLVVVGFARPFQAAHWPAAQTMSVERAPARLPVGARSVRSAGASPLVVTLDPLRLADDTAKVFKDRYRAPDREAARLRQRLGDLPHLVHRFADGLPLAVDLLADAVVRQQKECGTVDPWRLLDLPVPEASTKDDATTAVADRLLRLLVPDEEVRDDLVLFAAARDGAAARVLANWFLAAERRADAVARAERFLRQETRPRPGTRLFVADPLVRAVLLHRLGTRDARGGPGWDEVHGCLHAHYAGANPGGHGTGRFGPQEPARLRHALSLGRERQVADRLANAFGSEDERTWLAALAFVTTAPPANRLTRRLPDKESAGQPDPSDDALVRAAITRVVHNAWYLGDPRQPPDGPAIDRLKTDLELLSGKHRRSQGEILFRAATSWSTALREWRQDTGWLGSDGLAIDRLALDGLDIEGEAS